MFDIQMMIHNFPVACCMLCFVLGIVNILQPAAAELWPVLWSIILLLLCVLYLFGHTRHYLTIYTLSTGYLRNIYTHTIYRISTGYPPLLRPHHVVHAPAAAAEVVQPPLDAVGAGVVQRAVPVPARVTRVT